MDDLPFEIKHIICASAMETSRKTLQALSLVNHTWYQAAVPFLYERLQLCLTTTEQLKEDVEQLLEHPLRKRYLQYLRRLDLVGRSGKQSLQLSALQKGVEGPVMLDDFLDRELWQRQRHTFRLCSWETTTPDYAPLARLIAAVRSLREVNFVRAVRFPQEVLDVLHKYHPSCKLNLLYFYLQAWKHQGLSHRDMAVVTSPCLHSIRCYYYGNAGNKDVIESAILRLLCLAPNLKRVDLVLVPTTDFVDRRIYAFEPTHEASTAVARLETLSFSLNTVMSVQRFNQWRQKTDIAHLRTLSIGRIDEPTVARTICAVAPSFQRLERLSLNLGMKLRQRINYWGSVEEMIKALPPLKGLWLAGNRNAPFVNKVLSRHGATLQSLGLDSRYIEDDLQPQSQRRPYYNAQEIARFAKKCPVLRELHLTVHRVQGRPPEVKLYKALGRFPSLVHLCVKLDCVPSPVDPRDNLDPSSVPKHLAHYGFAIAREARTFYINAAIDEPLAKSIFNTILTSQSTGRLASLRLLPTCELRPGTRNVCVPDQSGCLFSCFAVTRPSNSDPCVLNINRICKPPKLPTWNSRLRVGDFYYSLRPDVVEWIWPRGVIKSFPLQDV
ncbi:hypothetical protein CDV55_102524 [Aspergillus turcosus]|uniref:Uncharacterized protein n=1 Tax=Aspergillus turcosus TaxID=1245748 RepID=A0A229X5S8_9EURO|nr:hypothetical protein CDV55_102524 [Aspergillus turcosus]RLL95273.1 hypothetical protein CFD26_102758 [Aspergillus turcosus]